MSKQTPETTRAVFDAAAAHFDDPALSFFVRFGVRSVEHAALQPGERVLDVCCGSGSSAIPAARAVGPAGAVLGVDLSDGLLSLARAKATDLGNVEFRNGDLHRLHLGAGEFDAVLCVFGFFFVDDMAAALRSLWRAVRPGGRLLTTTWGPRVQSPLPMTVWDVVRPIRPDLVPELPRWAGIAQPEGLVKLYESAGIPSGALSLSLEHDVHRLTDRDDLWTIVMGTGMREVVDKLTPEQQTQVREEVLSRFTAPVALDSDVIYTVARKGSSEVA
ncbi:MAG: methyltransferase domain-containing protein [Acidimicrobiia bacterium]